MGFRPAPTARTGILRDSPNYCASDGHCRISNGNKNPITNDGPTRPSAGKSAVFASCNGLESFVRPVGFPSGAPHLPRACGRGDRRSLPKHLVFLDRTHNFRRMSFCQTKMAPRLLAAFGSDRGRFEFAAEMQQSPALLRSPKKAVPAFGFTGAWLVR